MMSHSVQSLDQFANGLKYTVKVEIEVDYETIATTEIELPVTPGYQYLVNTDEVIEWLGKMERHVLPDDVKQRYEEYLESEF